MRALANLMLAVGFLGGAYVTVAHEKHIEWSLFGLFAFALLVGVVLTEMLRRAEAADDKTGADIDVLDECLAKLIESLAGLNAERAEGDGGDDSGVFEVRHRIDDDLMDDLDRFVERRESMIHRFDLQTYANVMSAFAASERLINRTWSASADGYVDEVRTCLGLAEEEMRSALGQLRAARGTV